MVIWYDMEELKAYLRERMFTMGLEVKDPYIAKLMIYLVKDLDLNASDKQKIEGKLIELQGAQDEEVLKYLEMEPWELLRGLEEAKNEEELRKYLLIDLMLYAVELWENRKIKMEELKKYLGERTIKLGLVPSKYNLWEMMMALVEGPYFNMSAQQTMEDEIMELQYASDEEMVEYLEVEPDEILQGLKEAKTEEELREYLLMDLMYTAVGAHRDDFPSVRRITRYWE